MNRKGRKRAGLFFGVVMTVTYLIQNLLGSNDLTALNVFIAVGISLLTGGVSALLFVWLLGIFLKSKSVRQAAQVDLKQGESILFQSPANHFAGIEAVGGMLTLTNQRLIFQSHCYNRQSHQCSVGLSELRAVDTYKTLRLVHNGLMITTGMNHTERFVVSALSEWVRKLKETLNSLPQPALH